jgi:hypothetical protein
VLLGQLGRLRTELGCPRERLEDHDRRPLRQAGELQVRPPDPAGQHDAAFQVPRCLVGCGCPVFRAAEADQRQRAQVRAKAGPRGVRDLGHGLQFPHVGGDGRQVPALAVQQQPDHPE